ncbi:MAG: tetratricopeptide repeat protein, partial [Pseudomonadota bacterium]
QIAAALAEAAVVVVIWTEGAIASRFVRAEVEKAERRRRLISLRPPDVPLDAIPMPYGAIDHVLTLGDDFGPVLKTIETVWQGRVPQGMKPLHVAHRDQYGANLFDPKRGKRPDDIAELTPSALLQARYEIVPYVDATGLLADTLAWSRGTQEYAEAPKVSAGRILHGPGGYGKTRAMIEAVRLLSDEGWLAGFHPPLDPSAPEAERAHRRLALEQVVFAGEEPGVLMVFDYAEARADDLIALTRMISRRPREGVRPFRLVLLSRGDAWWQEIFRTEPELQVLFNRRGAKHGDVHAVAPLPEGERRLTLFDATRAAYRPLIADLAAAGAFPQPVDATLSPAQRERLAGAPAYARPLALQMEALLSLVGQGADDIAELLKAILGLERAHWRRVIDGLSDTREEEMRRGLSQVTLVAGVETRRAAERLLSSDTDFGDRAPAALPLRELTRCYGAGRSGIAALEPDLIGEHEVASLGDERLIDACLVWIATLPEPDRRTRRRAVLTVLQRATRAEHGEVAEEAEAMLAHLIECADLEAMPDIVAVAVETPGRLPMLLEPAINALGVEPLAALESALPEQTVALASVADAVAARRERDARAADPTARTEDDEAAFGNLLHERGRTLSGLGRWEEALAATQEAVTIGHRLAASRPDAFEPNLARSLNNLSVDRSKLGRREEALAAAEESVTIRRRLAANRPDAFEPDLARSLNNLGAFLSNLGRWEEALAATEEAVAIRRRLAQARPDAFEPNLAGSVDNLGVRLSNLGHRKEALAATEEAVTIRRRLVASRPDAFEPDLARSLNNLGVDLSNLGRRAEALAATQEAVTIHRRLTQARPDAFEPDLAQNLNNLGFFLSDLGRREEALAAAEEAVAIRRRLAASRPEGFEPDLAQSLDTLSDVLRKLGRFAEAVAAGEEGIAVLTPHAKRRPEAHRGLMDELTATLEKARAGQTDDLGDGGE